MRCGSGEGFFTEECWWNVEGMTENDHFVTIEVMINSGKDQQ